MKTLIIYYSLTGTTRTLARRLATALDADLTELTCKRYSRGVFGYLMAAFDSLRGHLPDIGAAPSAQGYDLVLLGAPIWVGRPAPPIRAYLATRPDLPERVGVFLTSGGPGPHGTADAILRDALPNGWVAHLVATDKSVKSGESRTQESSFLRDLAG